AVDCEAGSLGKIWRVIVCIGYQRQKEKQGKGAKPGPRLASTLPLRKRAVDGKWRCLRLLWYPRFEAETGLMSNSRATGPKGVKQGCPLSRGLPFGRIFRRRPQFLPHANRLPR